MEMAIIVTQRIILTLTMSRPRDLELDNNLSYLDFLDAKDCKTMVPMHSYAGRTFIVQTSFPPLVPIVQVFDLTS